MVGENAREFKTKVASVLNKALAATAPLPATKNRLKEVRLELTLAAGIVRSPNHHQCLGVKLRKASNFVYYLICAEPSHKLDNAPVTVRSAWDDGIINLGSGRGVRIIFPSTPSAGKSVHK